MANVLKKEYDLVKEGEEEILKINANSWPYPPSIEGNALVMVKVIDYLAEFPSVSRIILNQRRNFIYTRDQTQMLIEVAIFYNHLAKQKKLLSISNFGDDINKYSEARYLVFNLLRSDPIGAYVEANRLIRENEIKSKRITNQNLLQLNIDYLGFLRYFKENLEKTKLISLVKNQISGHRIGDRVIYGEVFNPVISPDFILTRLVSNVPLDAEAIDSYNVNDTNVSIFKISGDIKFLYHVTPLELKLSEEEYELVNLARVVLAEHRPKDEEFLEPSRMRRTFINIGKDLLLELSEQKGYDIPLDRIKKLAEILVRATIGFGMVEILLEDQKVQDITINSPVGENPIFLMHGEYGECVTNIIPSLDDSEGWATKFRLLSARPLDEANPILDTELEIPGSRARVAIIGNPLNPFGLAFALRRHRDKPWTLPLFINNKMINPLGAGLMSFLIDGARTLLVAGTRSSGKTSFLGALLVEIMRKYRVILLEDSVTGDSTLLIKRNGKLERTTIGNLVDTIIDKNGCWYNLSNHEILGNTDNIEVLSMSKDGKIKFNKVSKFIRHKIKKKIYKIKTRTGREIKVTSDHSLFSIGKKANMMPVKVSDIKIGSHIAVPRMVNFSNLEKNRFDVFDRVIKHKNCYLVGFSVGEILKKYKYEIKRLGKDHSYSKSQILTWFKKKYLPAKIVDDLICLGYKLPSNNFYFKIGKSSRITLPAKINLTTDFITFIGLWLADGCYDVDSVIISSTNKEDREIVNSVANFFNLKTKMHSDNWSLMINSKSFKYLLREILELKGDAYSKRIPNFVYSLSKEQICHLLKGIFSGDGCVSDKEIVIPLSSINLLKDIQQLLSLYGIILRIGKLRRDKTYRAAISSLRSWLLFKENIGFLQNYKKDRLEQLCRKISTHDSSDIIPLSLIDKTELRDITVDFNVNDYLRRGNNIGVNKMRSLLLGTKQENELIININFLLNSDILWDEVAEISVLSNEEQYVYDLSVPETENFVCDNILAHNTLELPSKALRELGYNIQNMKVRSALTAGGTEVGADEGIRTSLRMGDSSLIVGEVRSLEAKSLYEAMRIGALANVVAGTIHGDSPYGVYDRVVNDLQVPKTSFKATDIIIITNPVKTAGGLKSFRRVHSITEVRKHWQDDPLKEKGFVDLMKYNTENDTLETTDELINGDSEILKKIAGNIKEFAGDWDAVWENIQLRAKMKEAIVNYANKTMLYDLLEAKFVIETNDLFHRIADDVKEETGALDNKRIFFEWDEWVKREIKKRGFL